MQKSRELRERLATRTTREQIAEAQGISAAFKPRVSVPQAK